MMDLLVKMTRKSCSIPNERNEDNLLMLGKCQNQKKKKDSSEDFLSTNEQSYSDGMNIETRSNRYILTRKTVVDITTSSVNHEEVNPSLLATLHDRISGMAKVLVLLIHMVIS